MSAALEHGFASKYLTDALRFRFRPKDAADANGDGFRPKEVPDALGDGFRPKDAADANGDSFGPKEVLSESFGRCFRDKATWLSDGRPSVFSTFLPITSPSLSMVATGPINECKIIGGTGKLSIQ